ncbi:MAG TPA: ATP-binding protein [Pyrinomonadaceae bacterium]|nr:ATP-binding protein [Pyrinomonadaceae bacterium]
MQNTLDVRTKLLVMLAVLSLPLLIISLVQLHKYRESLNEQSATLARVEAVAAAGVLESWAEARPALASGDGLSVGEAGELYARLARREALNGTHTVFVVFDPRGRAVVPFGDWPAISGAEDGLASPGQREWSDGVRRLTTVARADGSGWRVAAGVPLPENTPAGRGVLIVTGTWAFTLLATFGLAFWAVGRFTKPLRSLAASATNLGEGNLKERVRVETDDEVGTLARGFNAMAASLEQKFDAVRRQSAFIGEVLDSLPLGVAVLDARLVVRKVNASFAATVGRGTADLTGRGLYEAAAGLAPLDEVIENVRRSRRAYVAYSLPLELAARREGEGAGAESQKSWDVIVWPVMEQSEGRGDLIVILSEVSKRVRAEKLATAAFAAEKSRAAELESVIAQMNEGVVIVDAEGRYRINPAAGRILGRPPGEFRDGVKALLVDLTLRDAEGRVLAPEETPISRAHEGREHVSGERCRILRPDGAERVLEVSATPLSGEGGRRAGLVAVLRDITDEARHKDEMQAAYDRLREHDRLKSAFVTNVSHELRTPLNVILGLCQLLARDPTQPLAPLQSEAVGRMERNARALLEMVNDLLDYSRLEAGRSALRVEVVDVAEVIGAVVSEFGREAAEKGIELTADVSPALGAVRTDRRKLRQVVTCLVSNALKFTSAGRVSVVAAPDVAGRWYIEVSDTGIGISSDALKYIFDGFRQVDDRLTRSYNGVGLGLAITRKIVELLGGEISVESRRDEGSRFRINWPLEARLRTGTGSLVVPRGLSLAAEEAERRARAV